MGNWFVVIREAVVDQPILLRVERAHPIRHGARSYAHQRNLKRAIKTITIRIEKSAFLLPLDYLETWNGGGAIWSTIIVLAPT